MKQTKIELFEYDPLDFLDTEEKMIDYLNAELEEGDLFYIKRALSTIARARDVNSIIKKLGISQEEFYHLLSGDNNLDFSTVQSFLKVFNMHLIAVPIINKVENM